MYFKREFNKKHGNCGVLARSVLLLSGIAAGSFLFLTNASENIIFTGDLKNTEVLKNKPPRGKIYIV